MVLLQELVCFSLEYLILKKLGILHSVVLRVSIKNLYFRMDLEENDELYVSYNTLRTVSIYRCIFKISLLCNTCFF